MDMLDRTPTAGRTGTRPLRAPDPERERIDLRSVVLRNQGKPGLHVHKVSTFVHLLQDAAPAAGIFVSTTEGGGDVRAQLERYGQGTIGVREEGIPSGGGGPDLTIVFDLPTGRPLRKDSDEFSAFVVAQMHDLWDRARTDRVWIHLSDAHRYRSPRIRLRTTSRRFLGRGLLVPELPSVDYLSARRSFWGAVRTADLVLVETAAQLRWLRGRGLPAALFPGRLHGHVPRPDAGGGGGDDIRSRIADLRRSGARIAGVTGRALKGKKGTAQAIIDALAVNRNLAFVLFGATERDVPDTSGRIIAVGHRRLADGGYLAVLRDCDVLINVPAEDHPRLHGTGAIADAIAVGRPLITAEHLVGDPLLTFATGVTDHRVGRLLHGAFIEAAIARSADFDWSLWEARETARRLLSVERRHA